MPYITTNVDGLKNDFSLHLKLYIVLSVAAKTSYAATESCAFDSFGYVSLLIR
jgi:hypothetical protein